MEAWCWSARASVLRGQRRGTVTFLPAPLRVYLADLADAASAMFPITEDRPTTVPTRQSL